MPARIENVGGLKSIGKAGKAVTRQLGKTLTAMGESPNKRGQTKMALARNPHLLLTNSEKQGKKARRKKGGDRGVDSGEFLWRPDTFNDRCFSSRFLRHGKSGSC